MIRCRETRTSTPSPLPSLLWVSNFIALEIETATIIADVLVTPTTVQVCTEAYGMNMPKDNNGSVLWASKHIEGRDSVTSYPLVLDTGQQTCWIQRANKHVFSSTVIDLLTLKLPYLWDLLYAWRLLSSNASPNSILPGFMTYGLNK